jgi:hypothetical protein
MHTYIHAHALFVGKPRCNWDAADARNGKEKESSSSISNNASNNNTAENQSPKADKAPEAADAPSSKDSKSQPKVEARGTHANVGDVRNASVEAGDVRSPPASALNASISTGEVRNSQAKGKERSKDNAVTGSDAKRQEHTDATAESSTCSKSEQQQQSVKTVIADSMQDVSDVESQDAENGEEGMAAEDAADGAACKQEARSEKACAVSSVPFRLCMYFVFIQRACMYELKLLARARM